MAGIKEKLEVIFGVTGADKFRREFEQADKAVQKSSRSIKSSISAIGKAAIAYLSVQTVRAVGTAVFELGKMADQFRVVQQSSQRLSRSIGQDSQKILQAVRRGVGGAVSDLEILKQVNQAILLGIPVTADQMEHMAITATRLGRAVGRDASDALGDLITGIGRMSPMILDNLGITIRAEEAYRGLGEGATDAEKRLAFFNAVMEKANKRSKQIGETGATVSETWRKLTVKLSNFSTKIGTDLIPALNKVMNVMSSIVEETEEWYDKIKKVMEEAREGAGGASVGGRQANTSIARRKRMERERLAAWSARGRQIVDERAQLLTDVKSLAGSAYDDYVARQPMKRMLNSMMNGLEPGDVMDPQLRDMTKNYKAEFKKIEKAGKESLGNIPRELDNEFQGVFSNVGVGFSTMGFGAQGRNISRLGVFFQGDQENKSMTKLNATLGTLVPAIGGFVGAVGIFKGLQGMFNNKPDLTQMGDAEIEQRIEDLQRAGNATSRGIAGGGNVGEIERAQRELDRRGVGRSSGSNAFSVTTSISETQANSILAVLETQRAQQAEHIEVSRAQLAVQTDMKFIMSINSGNLLTFQG